MSDRLERIKKRIVEFHSSEQPYMSMSEAMYYRLVEPLVYRDLDGVLADIPAACCRRCGEVTLRSDTVANHLCTTQERTEHLVERGMEAFRAVADRRDQLAAAQERIAELEAALMSVRNYTNGADGAPCWCFERSEVHGPPCLIARAALAATPAAVSDDPPPAVPVDIPQAPTMTPAVCEWHRTFHFGIVVRRCQHRGDRFVTDQSDGGGTPSVAYVHKPDDGPLVVESAAWFGLTYPSEVERDRWWQAMVAKLEADTPPDPTQSVVIL